MLYPIPQDIDANYKVINSANRNKMISYEADFFGSSTSATIPWIGQAIASGTNSAQSSLIDARHPGVILIKSSSSGNSGYAYQAAQNTLLIAGGESSAWVINLSDATDTTARFAYQDSGNAAADATDGVYFEIVNGVIVGKTASNSNRSTTATSYTLTLGTWYSCVVQVNDTATLATFYVYDADGNLLWSDTLSTNLPTGTGRYCSNGLVVTATGGGTKDLLHLDYCNMVIRRVPNR